MIAGGDNVNLLLINVLPHGIHSNLKIVATETRQWNPIESLGGARTRSATVREPAPLKNVFVALFRLMGT